MYDFLRFEKETPNFKILYDQRIGGLCGLSREKIAARREFSLLVDELYDGKIILPPYAIVVLAESGRDMNDARTVGERNVIVAGDVIRLFAESEFLLAVRIQRLVFGILVFLPLLFGKNGIFFLPEHRGGKRFRQNIFLPRLPALDLDVIRVGIHAERDVGRKRPRRGRPCEDISVFVSLHLKFDESRDLFDVFITLRDLVRRKRRSAARAIGNDFMPLIKKSLFVDFFECPPLRFDVVVMIGHVRIVHVAPISYAIGHPFPFAGILPDGFFTFFYKRFYAVRLDFRLVVETELLFHFQFHGKPVRIPARLS